jgi:hypothetical protein
MNKFKLLYDLSTDSFLVHEVAIGLVVDINLGAACA